MHACMHTSCLLVVAAVHDGVGEVGAVELGLLGEHLQETEAEGYVYIYIYINYICI